MMNCIGDMWVPGRLTSREIGANTHNVNTAALAPSLPLFPLLILRSRSENEDVKLRQV
jgi:hypothetical protein